MVLVITGWYLMVPPNWDVPNHEPSNAPLSEWHVLDPADNGSDCIGLVAQLYAEMAGNPEKQRAFLREAQCISTDDPRLKPK